MQTPAIPVVQPLSLESDFEGNIPVIQPEILVGQLIEDAETPLEPVLLRPFPVRVWLGFWSLMEWCFGLATLFLGFSVLAAIPLGQFLALGYLLEASGRVARSGRIRDGFIGVRAAARFGGIALACGLLWLPLYYISLQTEAARIIDRYGRVARLWEAWLVGLTVFFALHASAAMLRGGRFRHFLNPFNVPWLLVQCVRGSAYSQSHDRVWETAVTLRLPYYFWLGVRGFAGAFVWLVLPLLLLGQAHRSPAVGIIGGILLACVVLYVPFLQVRFAKTHRFRAFFEVRALRDVYRRAPLAFTLALWIHLLFALPLYLLKIELIPRDLVFLEGLLFLLFIFPARIIGGWAYSRGERRPEPRFWLFRWFGRFAVVPVVLTYVLAVWISQHLGWHGVSSLYEQHAFLLPVPFVSWK